MIASVLLAQAMVIAPAGPAEAAVPATAWSCRLTDAQGAVTDMSGVVPELARGRDPNRAVFADQVIAGKAQVAAITGESGGEWFRDYQLTRTEGGATLVLNLKLRQGSEGVGYLTRFDPADGQKPYRYVAAGLCSADFKPAVTLAGDAK
jgi:hypothetical protein